MSARVKIYCPHCHHVVGDIDRSIDGLVINCGKCHKKAQINLVLSSLIDYR